MRSCIFCIGIIFSLNVFAGGPPDYNGDVELSTSESSQGTRQRRLMHLCVNRRAGSRLRTIESPYISCSPDCCYFSIYDSGYLAPSSELQISSDIRHYRNGVEDSMHRYRQDIMILVLQFSYELSNHLMQFFDRHCSTEEILNIGDVSCRCSINQSGSVLQSCSLAIYNHRRR